MKIRIIALALLLATLLGVFGCAPRIDVSEEDAHQDVPNFIGGKVESLNGTGSTRPAELLNLAATNADGNAKYKIVYPANTSAIMIEEYKQIADAIYETTGVNLAIGHELEKTEEFEILIGDVKRIELVNVTDEIDVDKESFLIKTAGTRLILFAHSDKHLIAAIQYLLENLIYSNADTLEFGVSADTEVLQSLDSDNIPDATVLSSDEHYLELHIPNDVVFSTYLRLSFTGNNGWRIQTKFKKDDAYKDEGASQLLARSLGEADPSVLEEITVSQAEGFVYAEASNGSCVAIRLKDFEMNFYTAAGDVAATITDVVTNTGETSITGTLLEGEGLFGTGERFNAANQRGKIIDMFSTDRWCNINACYMVIPLLSFSRGSGIFANIYEQMTWDLGATDENAWKMTVVSAPLDMYVFTTEQIADVIMGYSALSGYAEVPEEWTYGMLVCAYSPDFSQKWTADIVPSTSGKGQVGEGVYELIANMEKYDLPWTGVLAEGWGPYSWAKHEDLKELCDYVHSLGKKFMVYMSVGNASGGLVPDKNLLSGEISTYTEDYMLYQLLADGKKTFRIPETSSNVINPDNNGDTRRYLDITNPKAVKWFFEEYWNYLANDIGVDGCKIDFCEQMPENQPLLYYDESYPTSGSHHWYPTAFCAMFWDMISSKPDSGMCYTRGGGIGSQRAPYMWAGDQARGYHSLAWQLTAVLSSGLSGVPYMSYDMSGYQYNGVSKKIEDEAPVFLRGTQYTAFTLCMQTHGHVRRSYQFAEEDPNYLYVTEIYRAYVKLHEHLTPYITELSEQACATGMPVMRHLILGWQDDKNVYNIEDEYTFGDAFLIAPILDETNVRDIYLPAGEWIDLNTGEEYSVGAQGKWLKDYSATIAELPTFYNKNTESEIAPTLVDGIMELYDYARSVAP
ncbi:MAG: glycoside hydrolase family 31 protein [Clostridia bacterium]|nr:glycoside hydrolase family 31 protein [Clostridia bacterium]